MASKRQKGPGGFWFIRFTGPDGKGKEVAARTTDRRVAERMRHLVESRIASARVLEDTDRWVSPRTAAEWVSARWKSMNHRERQAVVFARDGGRCRHCSREVTIPLARHRLTQANRAVMDHLIPIVAGGADTIDNIVLSCHPCNMAKLDGR